MPSQTTVAALPLPKRLDRRSEVTRAEIGPQGVDEQQLGVGRLPQQEIRQPVFARRADHQVERRQLARLELAFDRSHVDRGGIERSVTRARRQRLRRAHQLGLRAVVECDRQDWTGVARGTRQCVVDQVDHVTRKARIVTEHAQPHVLAAQPARGFDVLIGSPQRVELPQSLASAGIASFGAVDPDLAGSLPGDARRSLATYMDVFAARAMAGVYRRILVLDADVVIDGGDPARMLYAENSAALFAAGILIVPGLHFGTDGPATLAFGGLLKIDSYALFAKALIYLAAIAALMIAPAFFASPAAGTERGMRAEYPVLVIFAAVGMSLMVSANDFMSLYLGLELNSLSAYVLAAILRRDTRSGEAGLKYFVLGALASGILLYGISLLYGFTGGTSFDAVRAGLTGEMGTGALFGVIFVLSGLAFKISAVPFHMWTPDVYEGAPTPVTAFFATAPKVAAVGLTARVVFEVFGGQVAGQALVAAGRTVPAARPVHSLHAYFMRPGDDTQPITFARDDAPAMLLVTSDGDETVRPRNADNLGAKLKGLGAPVEVKNYGPLSHEEVVMALSVPFRSKGPVLADSVAFLKARLGE